MQHNQCTDDASCPMTDQDDPPLCCDYAKNLYKDFCSGTDDAKIDKQVRI